MRERSVEQHLSRRVQAMGGRSFKWTSPGQAGVPDRLVFLPGGIVGAIELKRPGQTLAPLQLHVAEVLRSLGATVGWADSPAAVDAWLTGLVQ